MTFFFVKLKMYVQKIIKIIYECQFRFIIPTTRPNGRNETGFVSPAELDVIFVVLGAPSALHGTR